ncbi:uncharacterized protein LOC116966962 [Amblyraja radiata]|uniref:uncharacterized protein LOC116966962 n=1 Tax=Amblyraja radiata TaxID=386614 RepID=UPI00140217E2|nr:uncharacterized protein LOC116966962 [Amblyraja radiata]
MLPLARASTILLLCGLVHNAPPPLGMSQTTLNHSYTPSPWRLEIQASLGPGQGSSEPSDGSNTTVSPTVTGSEGGERHSGPAGETATAGAEVTDTSRTEALTTEPWAGTDPTSTVVTTALSGLTSTRAVETHGHASSQMDTSGAGNNSSAILVSKAERQHLKADKGASQSGTLGVFIGLAVVLTLVLGLVYLIYSKTHKDDPFSHQRLYTTDPVLSLDVSVEPADRFYGGLGPALVTDGQGAPHRPTHGALAVPDPPSKAEIQLKPISESSVKLYL